MITIQAHSVSAAPEHLSYAPISGGAAGAILWEKDGERIPRGVELYDGGGDIRLLPSAEAVDCYADPRDPVAIHGVSSVREAERREGFVKYRIERHGGRDSVCIDLWRS